MAGAEGPLSLVLPSTAKAKFTDKSMTAHATNNLLAINTSSTGGHHAYIPLAQHYNYIDGIP
jgi:hypothetical protein